MIAAKKGVALISVLLLSVILLIISGTMVNFIIKESQGSVRTENSVAAYAAAKSGVEWFIKEKKEPGFTLNDCNSPRSINITSGDNSVFFRICRVGADLSEIKSTGSVGGALRTIVYRDTSVAFTDITLGTSSVLLPTPVAASENFELLLRFYPKSSNPPSFRMGLSDDTVPNNGLVLSYASSNLRLGRQVGAGFYTGTSVSYPGGIDLGLQVDGTNNYTQRGLITARIKFLRGEFATVRYEGNYEFEGSCRASGYYQVTSGALTNAFNYLYFYPSGTLSGGELSLGASSVSVMSAAYRRF